MISLMNRLLLEEKLDLRLTPYNALATSVDAGLMECVPNSTGVGDILRKYSTIGKFLQNQSEFLYKYTNDFYVIKSITVV